MESILHEQNKITEASYIRPVEISYCQEEGHVVGQVQSAHVEERDSRYSDNGKRQVLFLRINALTQAGEVPLTYFVTYSWSMKSKMVGLLEKLGLLPAPGYELKLDAFEGIMVDMVIENVQKDGRTFTNIMSIRKRPDFNQ